MKILINLRKAKIYGLAREYNNLKEKVINSQRRGEIMVHIKLAIPI